MSDILYVETGYVDAGYITYTAQAEVAITSRAQVPTDPYVVADYMQSGFVLDAAISPVITRSGEVSITGLASTLSAAGRTRGLGADLAVVPSLQATAAVTRDAGLSRARPTWDDVTSWQDWLRTVWDPSDQQGVLLFALSTFGAAPRSSTDAAKDFSVTASLAVTATRVQVATSAITSTVSVTATPVRIRSGANLAQAVFSQVTAAERTRPGESNLATTSEVTVSGTRTRSTGADLALVGAITVESSRIRTSLAQIEAFNSVLAASARSRGFGCDITAVASVSAAAARSRQATALLENQTQLLCDSIRIGAVRAELASAWQITAVPVRVRTGSPLNQVATTAVNILGGIRADGQADLQTTNSITCSARKISIDYRLQVPSETRQYPVLADVRGLTVVNETRLNKVLEEERSLEVPEETRVYQVI